jgi:tetrahydromethanopterin S-methyltransferase subunit G
MNGDIEHTNLEAHVAICKARFQSINERLDRIEEKLKEISACMTKNNGSTMKTVIYSAGTVVAGLLSTIVVLLLKL